MIRRLFPTRTDLAAVGLGTAAPLLLGSMPDPSATLDVHQLLMMAVVSAAGAAGGLAMKVATVGAAAFLRAKRRRWRADANPGNDDAGEALGAIADRIDPEGREPPEEITNTIKKGPNP